MGKVTGFLEWGRELPPDRPVPVRIRDWKEIHEPFPLDKLQIQAGRCMDCGIPFCHEGCPLGNLIPDWNDLVYRSRFDDAIERLHATNNFPDFTGRLCPAPCESACVLGINQDPVAIKQVEHDIVEHAWEEGLIRPVVAQISTGKRVAVVGSGPSGLAAAQQLARAGHEVDVYERAPRPGGLLRYGIPEFKMEKWVLDRRLAQMEKEGVRFVCSVVVGRSQGNSGQRPQSSSAQGSSSAATQTRAPWDTAALEAREVPVEHLTKRYDAVVVSVGSTMPRLLEVPGGSGPGVHAAMEYLKGSNLVREGALDNFPIDAKGKRVVIIGGGDTGADCLGTAHRQGALSVHQLEILPQPPRERTPDQPWPTYPMILRVSGAHEEGGERVFAVETTEVLRGPDGQVDGLALRRVETVRKDGRLSFEPVPGSEFELPCDLVLLAMGFVGPQREGLLEELNLELTPRGTIAVDSNWQTSLPGIFACGDAVRGQSLIVWAISEGRSCAAGVDRWLMGETALPEPLVPGQMALT